MRWLICALLSVILVTVGVILVGGDETNDRTEPVEELPSILERAAALDERLLRIGTESRELSGFFSETGIGEELGVLESRLRAIKVGLQRVEAAAGAADPLVRDGAERQLAVHESALAEQERRFATFVELFERMRPQYINAFGRNGRVTAILQRLIEVGTPCQNQQATAREMSAIYRNGRRFFFGELGRVLNGEEPDETVIEVASGAFRQTYEGLQPLYEHLQPVDIELNRIESQEKTLTTRLEWARGVREALGDDPWLATPEADLDARAAEWRTLAERAAKLKKNALAETFIADSRVLVQDTTVLLRTINAYVSKARQAGLPLPR